MRTFTITTLGCKVNRYESEAIFEQLANSGWHPAAKGTRAELCIINTCAVTGKAAMQSRQAVRKAIRSHPGATVLVTGCYAQVSPDILASITGVHCVAGNTFKNQIAQLVKADEKKAGCATLVEDISQARPFQDLPIRSFGGRTRPFVKIQDGCDSFCSYCVIPHARGRSRSLDSETAVSRVNRLQEQGYREVVLSGINIGRYGQDLSPQVSLLSLLQSLEGSKGVKRLRVSSIEPAELTHELIAHMANSDTICRHLHIPLQSGDDDILRAMNRPYTSKSYRDLIHDIVDLMPDAAIGVDVMAGFPGEDERAFDKTCRLIEELPIAYLHVFPFSVREGTLAQSLGHQVPPGTIKTRCQHLRNIGQTKRMEFYERSLGLTVEVLVESKRDRATGYLKGLTRNYIPVFLDGADELFHELVQVRVTRMEDGKPFAHRV